MDEKLLAEAKQAQERLIDAERDAEVARATSARRFAACTCAARPCASWPPRSA